jgi:hypothetical protein
VSLYECEGVIFCNTPALALYLILLVVKRALWLNIVFYSFFLFLSFSFLINGFCVFFSYYNSAIRLFIILFVNFIFVWFFVIVIENSFHFDFNEWSLFFNNSEGYLLIIY